MGDAHKFWVLRLIEVWYKRHQTPARIQGALAFVPRFEAGTTRWKHLEANKSDVVNLPWGRIYRASVRIATPYPVSRISK